MDVKIAQNILKFLERVQATGLEAYAWCEAHAAVAKEVERLIAVEREKIVKQAVDQMKDKSPLEKIDAP
jgi:hypothetical protein